MNTIAWPAPAKINLFLHITGRRPDGYHLLQTHFQFLDFGDDVHMEVREDGLITRESDLAGVPPEQDLVVRAAQAQGPLAPPPLRMVAQLGLLPANVGWDVLHVALVLACVAHATATHRRRVAVSKIKME